MRLSGTQLDLSATDLSNFLACRHRTALDMAVALGTEKRPPKYEDPLLEILWQRGLEHEQRYVEKLKAQGLTVTDLRDIQDRDEHVAKTREAIEAGIDVIVQGALRDGRWFGLPDVLRKVSPRAESREPNASRLLKGTRRAEYEVVDTKLSRDTKTGTILQLGLYSEMLALVQGSRPERFCVVTPYAEHEYRLDDFAAYVRMVRRQMLATVEMTPEAIAEAHYPEPVDHCGICHWSQKCDRKRHDDDHLSLVAGISRIQRRELEGRKVKTLEQLAAYPLDGFRKPKPKRGSVETYLKVREQARIQLESRQQGKVLFELRPMERKKDFDGNDLPYDEGLCRLPEPSPGDVFLDLEGDPFAGDMFSDNAGREYLFGVVTLEERREPRTERRVSLEGHTRRREPVYQAFWAFTEREEREAFERMMDLIMQRLALHPDMHVYHYAPYEPSAFKRLMGRHVTRERDLDALLRAGKFVDLYGVVRQGLRVGTERYSIKNLEPLYGFEREVRLADANRCLREIEKALELDAPELIPGEVREAVRGYNEDDCVSTLRLRDWLEQVRLEHIAKGWDIPRPAPAQEEVKELTDFEKKVAGLRKKLLKGVPEGAEEQDEEQRARWLLAYLLDYHNREDKAVWWEYFRLRELPEEDLVDEPRAIVGLEFVKRIHVKRYKSGKPTGSVTDRYRYPAQEMEIERGELHLRQKESSKLGKLAALDRDARTVDIEKGPAKADVHPSVVFEHTRIPPAVIEESLFLIAERVIADGEVSVKKGAADRVGRALLRALPPRRTSGAWTPIRDGDTIVDNLKRAALELDHCVLPVQGPPGAGKTYVGARMICALVAAGKKVGVAGFSHKAIRKLLEEVVLSSRASARDLQLSVGHRGDAEDYPDGTDGIATFTDNGDARDALASGDVQVLGGTTWLWARPDMEGAVDVLFVDEAGQLALANVLAASPSASSIVLLGDPQQLTQPTKGSHPEGVGCSALEHVLRGHKTVPHDRGVFLPLTWRLTPKMTEFTSEVFYERRLASREGLDAQRIVIPSAKREGSAVALFDQGLFVVKATHDGNRTSSIEEIELVADLVKRLTHRGVTWTDAKGKAHQMRGEDVLIVAPYNAQVSRLKEELEGTGARVGTVDKFQGQEAPVVVYSMATSRPEDAPRGMEFLYSMNRLNVATSRARCAAVVVASERLFEPECRTVRQIKLASALCRYRELSVG